MCHMPSGIPMPTGTLDENSYLIYTQEDRGGERPSTQAETREAWERLESVKGCVGVMKASGKYSH